MSDGQPPAESDAVKFQSTVQHLTDLGAKIKFSTRRNVLEIDFRAATGMIDDPIAADIVCFHKLRALFVPDSQISSQFVTTLASLTGLKTLDLENTAIGDECIDTIRRFPKLELVNLRGTRITKPAVDDLRKKMIDTRIIY